VLVAKNGRKVADRDRKDKSKKVKRRGTSPPLDGDWERYSSQALRTKDRKERSKSREEPPVVQDRSEYRFDSPPKDIPDGATSGGPTKVSNFSGPPGHATSTQSGALTSLSSVSESSAASTDSAVSSQTSLALICQQMGLSAEAAKAARELYVGNLPPGVDVNQLVEFLNAAMAALNANIKPGPPATKAWISTDGHYAFVEFRSMEEATNGMQLNGLNCLGYALRIGRPKTYPPELQNLVASQQAHSVLHHHNASAALVAAQQVMMPQMMSPGGMGMGSKESAHAQAIAAAACITGSKLDSSGSLIDRLCVLDLPHSLSEEKVRELITVFGPLRFFQFVRHDTTKTGICMFEYEDQTHQSSAIGHLNGLEIAGQKLCVMKAEDCVAAGLLADIMKGDTAKALGGELMRPQVPTRVIMLANLVVADELLDDKEYEEIREDVKLECQEYGDILSLEVPRPARGFSTDDVDQSDVGFAFVEFRTVESTTKAKKALSGRKFAGRTVEAHYFSERKYAARDLKAPAPCFTEDDSSLYNPSLSAHIKLDDANSDAESEDMKVETACCENGAITV